MTMKPWKILLIFSFLLHIDIIITECNVCQENQAACINSTSFYLCFGAIITLALSTNCKIPKRIGSDGFIEQIKKDTPNTEVLYHCKDGFDCTNLNAICVQKSNARPPSCGDTSLCGMCSAHRNYVFACLSRTTFQMCYGAIRPSGQIGYCPTGTICDANNDNVCVNQNQQHTITCDVVSTDSSTTTITTPTTEETSTIPDYPLTPDEVCAQMREVGLFPTMPHDPFCRRYIYCYINNSVIRGIEYTCSSNSYFNIEQELCTFVKPAYCI